MFFAVCRWLKLHEVPQDLLDKLEDCAVSGKILAKLQDHQLCAHPYYIGDALHRFPFPHPGSMHPGAGQGSMQGPGGGGPGTRGSNPSMVIPRWNWSCTCSTGID